MSKGDKIWRLFIWAWGLLLAIASIPIALAVWHELSQSEPAVHDAVARGAALLMSFLVPSVAFCFGALLGNEVGYRLWYRIEVGMSRKQFAEKQGLWSK